MYFLTGHETLLRHVRILSALAGTSQGSSTLGSLADQYRLALRSEHELGQGPWSSFAPELVVQPDEAALVRRTFSVDGQAIPAEEAEALLQGVMAYIASHDRVLAELIRLLVVAVLFDRSPTPGSTSGRRLPGVIWLAPTAEWDVATTAEALIHEFTHTAQMLDERCRSHYYPAGAGETMLAMSAIRQCPRPLAAVVPSIVVAHELIAWRRLTGEPSAAQASMLHGTTGYLVASCSQAIASVRDLPCLSDLVTPLIVEWLDRVEDGLAQPLAEVAS